MPYDELPVLHRSYIIGLDLGQISDFAALALIEMTDTGRATDKPQFDVTYLHRFPIGTPYPKIVASIAKMLEAEPFCANKIRRIVRPSVTLAIDATGVGRPVVDMFAEARLRANLWPITITGGNRARNEGGGWLVPKRILVSTLQVALQNQRLRIAAKLPEAVTLQKELQDFQLTFTEAKHETYEGRRGSNDDLVLAVAIGLWAAKNAITRVTEVERDIARSLGGRW
jgi:hypothetical protein